MTITYTSAAQAAPPGSALVGAWISRRRNQPVPTQVVAVTVMLPSELDEWVEAVAPNVGWRAGRWRP